MEDRFGRLPEEAENLMRVLAIKVLAGGHGFSSVVRGKDSVVCRYRDATKARALSRKRPRDVRVVDSKTVHLIVGREPILERVLQLLA